MVEERILTAYWTQLMRSPIMFLVMVVQLQCDSEGALGMNVAQIP